MEKVDVVIIGAGAAGLMCAMEAGKRGRRVVILDHANKAGKKILMSGGGRCNFTNYFIDPEKYISHNPHFCKSALTRYTQWDFISLVKKHHISFHEKTLGQLFCDHKSQEILQMLLIECKMAAVDIRLAVSIQQIEKSGDQNYRVMTNQHHFQCESVVIATGGLSIPTMGASPFGYKIAKLFGVKVWPTRAGLVPLTLQEKERDNLAVLSGIAVNSIVSNDRIQFHENILFTHRGLSGPAILQISSYWEVGESFFINLLPDRDLIVLLKSAQRQHSQKQLKSILSDLLPKRVIEVLIEPSILDKQIASLSSLLLQQIADKLQCWLLKPNGTEGYRTAEVTLGGVDCNALSSKTMEVKHCRGLYFIGEVVDVTGWLGGYNFQWAFSSGWAAGQVV